MVRTTLVGKVLYKITLIPGAAGPGDVEDTEDIRPIGEENWNGFAKALGFKNEKLSRTANKAKDK